MTIANQILAFYTKTTEFGDDVNVPDLMGECEQKAVNKNQDWDNESTTYEFADGSVIVVCNNEARHYGSKE